MPRIKIVHSAQTPTIRLEVNGEKFALAATGESEVPDRFMGALNDSAVQFEIVDSGNGAGEAGVGAVGGLGDAPANLPLPESLAEVGIDAEHLTEEQGGLAPPDDAQAHPEQGKAAAEIADNADLAILDHNVEDATAKLDQLDGPRLTALREAEVNGKSRVTMLAAIDDALAARQE